MELQSISIVSKHFNISVRTLRYYEEIGLITSEKKNESSYRFYSQDTIKRIQQIVILRKLRIPLKQIAEILQDEDAKLAIEVFQQNLYEIDDEITALSTIKDVIESFVERLSSKNAKLQLLDDKNLLEIVDSLTISKINFKEGKTMEELNKANDRLSKLTDRDIRYIYLPPMTIAAYYCKDHSTSDIADEVLKTLAAQLILQKPDLRRFNFLTHKTDTKAEDGFELWLTIPEDMEVPQPLIKRQFNGGLYASYTIPCGAYDEWVLLKDWVHKQSDIKTDWTCRSTRDTTNQEWVLEEVLNYHGIVTGNHIGQQQVDLLLPIKEEEKKENI